MRDDPKQIVTPFAFEVHPDLLGLPLATPKRRLLALFIDLIIAAILTSLGNLMLALASTGIFVWIAIRTRNDVPWQNALRYSGAAIAGVFVFMASLGVLSSTDVESDLSADNVVVPESVDWREFANKMATTDFTNENDLEALEEYADKMDEDAFSGADSEIRFASYDSLSITQLFGFLQSISNGDSLATDSLRELVAANIAAPEISELETRNGIFSERIDDLEDINEDLREEVENPGFIKAVIGFGEDFGLTFGWVGIYFILSLALFQGHTAGKKLLGLKVVRLNNKPIGIWYSFERFGGYAAGIATGLLGFFQIFWDANRQGIHDKIASTVVVDLREKKKQKFEDLSKKVLRTENLLADDEPEQNEF
jgi:hypothetical protein